MPQFMISVWHDDEYEVDFSTPDAQRRVTQVGDFNTALENAGALVFACGLMPRSDASVFTSQEGAVLEIDGPYVEAKEHIGGFWIIEAADRDAATAWAKQAASACEGPIELRRLQGD